MASIHKENQAIDKVHFTAFACASFAQV
jgi:hypothetical protein